MFFETDTVLILIQKLKHISLQHKELIENIYQFKLLI